MSSLPEPPERSDTPCREIALSPRCVSLRRLKIFMPAGREKPVYAPYIEHVPPDVLGQLEQARVEAAEQLTRALGQTWGGRPAPQEVGPFFRN